MRTLSQVLQSVWLGICFVLVFSLGWTSHYWISKPNIDNDHPPTCQNEKYRTAWLAKKDGRYRCFQEMNQWPYRAFGYNIPDEPPHNYATPLEFIQRELRFDFREEEYPDP